MDLSFTSLIMEASITVQLVMLLLLIASVASWAIIWKKARVIRRARDAADGFETSFWSGGDLDNIYDSIHRGGDKPHGIPAIFEGGYREFGRLAQQSGASAERVVEGSRRAMRVALTREVDRLEQSLATLATIGSTSPYVGLFGTVVGIMRVFGGLGNMQSATLQTVAPGIAEALIATAMGLVAAIPAVIFYNRFADQVARLENRYDTFMDEFSSILERHANRRRAA